MLNRLTSAVVRAERERRDLDALWVAGAKRRGTVYAPSTGAIAGWNFGTSVRPDVQRITVNTFGDETVASFLSRGGQITTVAPKRAKGAVCVGVVRSNPTHVRTSRG